MDRGNFLKSSSAALAATGLSSNLKNRIVVGGSSLVSVEEGGCPGQPASSARARLLLDFGWRFHLGHADDAAKDFGLGARRRESQFAKSGNFLPVSRAAFQRSAARFSSRREAGWSRVSGDKHRLVSTRV